MHNRLNRARDEKVPGQGLTNCPFDLGDFSLRENWDLINHNNMVSSTSTNMSFISNTLFHA